MSQFPEYLKRPGLAGEFLQIASLLFKYWKYPTCSIKTVGIHLLYNKYLWLNRRVTVPSIFERPGVAGAVQQIVSFLIEYWNYSRSSH